MNAFFRKKIAAAVLFILCLFTLSFLNIRSAWGLIEHSAAHLFEGGLSRFSTVELEAAINAGVYEKYLYIETFDYFQRIMGKEE